MPSKTGSRKSNRALDRLGQDEAAQVLSQLVKNHPELGEDAEALALKVITAVDPESVAEDVVWEFEGLDQDDIWERSGHDRFGAYTEPWDAANEICEERLAPFLEELERLLSMGQMQPALDQVKGLLLGLHRLQGHLPPDAEDYPSESGAYAVLEAWAAKGPAGEDQTLLGWIKDALPEWAGHLERLWGPIRERARKVL